jgi:hypothetical protein
MQHLTIECSSWTQAESQNSIRYLTFLTRGALYFDPSVMKLVCPRKIYYELGLKGPSSVRRMKVVMSICRTTSETIDDGDMQSSLQRSSINSKCQREVNDAVEIAPSYPGWTYGLELTLESLSINGWRCQTTAKQVLTQSG